VRITPEFYIGAGFQNLYFSLNNKTVLAGCTQINCAPEDPQFDALTQVKATAPFTPSGNFGMLFVNRWVRVGASVQMPYWVHASGTVATKLPSDPQFDGATVVGNGINVDVNLPLIVRGGVEIRPHKHGRFEIGADYEMWSTQQSISFAPQGVYIDHIAGIGRYDLRPMTLDRGMTDVVSVHIGGEIDVLPKRLTLRAGYMFESSAVPDAYLTVLTPDGDKHLVTLGASLRIGSWRLDAAYGHFFQPDRTVTESKSLQLNPIQPSIAVPVGAGTYHVVTDVLAVGLEKRFD
jgi:long-chain fatty acid transport protein